MSQNQLNEEVPSVGQTPIKEFNILLLSETGVGKSTFINALVNYLTYETFEAAQNSVDHKFICHIPTKFAYNNSVVSQEELFISVGQDPEKNEIEKMSVTQTQHPKSYLIGLDSDVAVRFIDTPGLCNTDGVKKDSENVQNILNTLSKYEHLNAICLLLKPDIDQLSVSFRYCLKEILVHLHKSAAKNLLFCFTHSKG